MVPVALACAVACVLAAAPPLAAQGLPADTAALGTAVPESAAPDSVAAPAPPARAFEPAPAALAGVLWAAPDSVERAVADLEAMHRAGIRAVRTALVEDAAILRAADRLGIALAQDLPVADLSTRALADTLDGTARLFADALARARRHPSARLFVLAQGVDTSDPRSRPYFERLTALARERGAPGTKTAYLTRFVESDRASQTVDLVLLDARGQDPFALLRRWRARHETPAGLGAYGEGVVPGREGGWREPGTLARQARSLETTLDALLTRPNPPAVAFLARWRDRDERGVRAAVANLRYGLLADDDTPRPAFAVAQGFFTGEQRVFAFDAGPRQDDARQTGGLVVFGWLLVLGLGALVAGSPRLSTLVPRYFSRRDLYREAVQKGYDLSTGVMAALAGVLALVAGAVGAAVVRALGHTDALAVAVSGLSPDAQQRTIDLAGSPFALVFVLATAYATWLLASVIWLGIISGRRRLRPAQALALAVWPRWMWFGLLVLAMVLAATEGRMEGPFAAVVLALALTVETVASYRMLSDLSATIGVPTLRALGLGFAVPALVVLVGAAIAAAELSGAVGFLWHLATRS